MEKTLNSRIINKHDLEINWLKAINFVPKQGELIVYDIDDKYTYQRFKIGDGVTKVNDLPFIAKPDWNAKEGTAGYIENRTHYDDGFDLTYDGNYENYPHHILEDGAIIVQVSDTPLTKEEIVGATGEGVINGQQMSQVLDENILEVDEESGEIIGINSVFFSSAVPVPKGNGEFVEPGVYFYHIQNYGMLTRLYKEELKQLDEKYIPDSIARKEEVAQADWNENDETRAAYVKNRTHYVGTLEIEWDGVIDGHLATESHTFMSGAKFVKVSDFKITEQHLPIQLLVDCGEQIGIQTFYNACLFKEDGSVSICEDLAYYVPEDNFVIEPELSHHNRVVFPEKGLYFIYNITPDGTVQFGKTLLANEVHQLHEKFIPSTIARTDNLPVAITPERITEICGIAPVMAFAVNDEGDALVNAGWPDDNGNIQI